MPRLKKNKSAFTYVLQVWLTSLVVYPLISFTVPSLWGIPRGPIAESLAVSFTYMILYSAPYFLFLCASVPVIQRRPWRVAVKKFAVVVTSVFGATVLLSLLVGLTVGWDWALPVFALNGLYLVVMIVAVVAYRWPGTRNAGAIAGERVEAANPD